MTGRPRSRVDDVLAALDAGLQSSPESSMYNDVAPSVGSGCVRCPSADVAEGGELCGGCRAFLLGDTETDPAAAPVAAQRLEVPRLPDGRCACRSCTGDTAAPSISELIASRLNELMDGCQCPLCTRPEGVGYAPIVAPPDETTLRLDLLMYGNAYEVSGRRVSPTDVTVITSDEFTAPTTEARRWRMGDGATAVADVVRVRLRPPDGPPDDRGPWARPRVRCGTWTPPGG